MESKKIPLKEFVSRLENKANALLKDCVRENTQFSTKYIIQNIISRNESQLGLLLRNKGLRDKPVLPERLLGQQDWNQVQVDLKKDFDLENLNFLEANQLAIRMNEYLISAYRSIQVQTSSTPAKKVLAALIRRLQNSSSRLKKEHQRLSSES